MKKLVTILFAITAFSCQKKINTEHSYDFEFCENCKTLDDIFAFEKSRGAKEIKLTGKQASRIFNGIRCPFFPYENNSKDARTSRYYFLKNTKKHFAKEISAYSIIDESFFFTARKYFYNDAVLDTIVEMYHDHGFNREEFKAMFNHLRQEYRAQFKNIDESHSDMNEFCERKRTFEIELPKFLEKSIEETHSSWYSDSLEVSLIYDFSYMFNKLNEETNTIELEPEDRAIYILKNYSD